MKFMLYHSDTPGTVQTTLWKNDDSSPEDDLEPSQAIVIGFTNGLYSLVLGDDSAIIGESTTFQEPITSALAPPSNSDLYLRIWFNDGSNGFQQLTPDKKFASVPFARHVPPVPNDYLTYNSLLDDSTAGFIRFQDPNDNYAQDNLQSALTVLANKGDVHTDSTNNLTGFNRFQGTTEFQGSISSSGNNIFSGLQTEFRGNVFLGDSTDDEIHLTGLVASNIVPKSVNNATLGSATEPWDRIFVKGTNAIEIQDSTGVSGAVHIDNAGGGLFIEAPNSINLETITNINSALYCDDIQSSVVTADVLFSQTSTDLNLSSQEGLHVALDADDSAANESFSISANSPGAILGSFDFFENGLTQIDANNSTATLSLINRDSDGNTPILTLSDTTPIPSFSVQRDGDTFIRKDLTVENAITTENITIDNNLVLNGSLSLPDNVIENSDLQSDVLLENEDVSLLNNDAGYLTNSSLPADVIRDGSKITRLLNNAGYLSSISGLNISLLSNDSNYLSGDGNVTINGELCVDDDVLTSGSFKYKSPQTRKLQIPAFGFFSSDSDDIIVNGPTAAIAGGIEVQTSANLGAPVGIPAGATVTKLTVQFYSNNNGPFEAQRITSVTCSLNKRDMLATNINASTVLASVTESNSSGVALQQVDSTISNASISENDQVFLSISLATSSNAGEVGLIGATIEYTTNTLN